MKRNILYIIFFLLFTTKINAIDITNVEDVNKNEKIGYFDDIDGNSSLELNFRSKGLFIYDNGEDGSDKIGKYYPRIKKIGNYYILTYHGNAHTGENIYYSISEDLKNWSEPQILWNNYIYAPTYPDNTGHDHVYFSGCDILPLKDGSFMAYASYHSGHYYTAKPYSSALVMRKGKIVNENVEWEKGDEIETYSWSQSTGYVKNEGTLDIGTVIYRGPAWEPHAFYDNDGNIVMLFTNAEPINKNNQDIKKIYNHTSTGVATIVSSDNGKTWTDAKFSAFKFSGKLLGDYTVSGRTVNFYTAQMPVTTRLNDGRYFTVYEMWIPTEEGGVPENVPDDITSGYSISASIFSKNYDYKIASGISTDDSIANSLTDNPTLNDPRGQLDYSGDEKSFYTIAEQGAAPYVLQFPSGEVAVSYNFSSQQYLKLLDGKKETNAIESLDGISWGSIDLNSSHSLIACFPDTRYSVSYENIYLNHKIDTNFCENIYIDGNNEDWKEIDDALFIGSDSQAQSIIRFSHNKDKIYILVERLDEELLDADEMTIKLAFDNNIYSLNLNNSNVKLTDEHNNIIDIDSEFTIVSTEDISKNGIVYEIAIDKDKILYSDVVKIYASLKNIDNNSEYIEDILSNTIEEDLSTWLKVKLIDNPKEYSEKNENIEQLDYVPNTYKNNFKYIYILSIGMIIVAILILYNIFVRKQ